VKKSIVKCYSTLNNLHFRICNLILNYSVSVMVSSVELGNTGTWSLIGTGHNRHSYSRKRNPNCTGDEIRNRQKYLFKPYQSNSCTIFIHRRDINTSSISIRTYVIIITFILNRSIINSYFFLLDLTMSKIYMNTIYIVIKLHVHLLHIL